VSASRNGREPIKPIDSLPSELLSTAPFFKPGHRA
jgi:hypothetical protein